MTRFLVLVGFVGVAAACSSPAPTTGGFDNDGTDPTATSAATADGKHDDAGSSQGSFTGSDAGSTAPSQDQGQTCSAPGTSQACYPFATGKADVGVCKSGTQACVKSGEFGQLAQCMGAVGPTTEKCGDGIDDDCDGVADNGCEPPDAGVPVPVNAKIEFHHLSDTASWTNCLKIQVNGGPETDLGCNKGAPLLAAQVMANAAPFCNVVRLNLYSNGKFNKSTSNANDIAKSFIINKISAGNFNVKCNDNSDNDFNDLNATINAVGDVRFTIENTGIGCN